MLTRSHVVACVLVASGTSLVRADILNFRDWLTSQPTTPNAASNEWYGTRGLDGPLLTSDTSMWSSPAFTNAVPLLALRTTVGSDNGAAGPATFDGCWAHPGNGLHAVLVFAPTTPVWVGAMNVRSELIANGLSGNGVTITVYSTIGGSTTPLGTTTLTGIDSRLDAFTLPNLTLLNPGDRLSVAFGDNGSYLFDHVNFNAWVTIPAPASACVFGALGLAFRRRR